MRQDAARCHADFTAVVDLHEHGRSGANSAEWESICSGLEVIDVLQDDSIVADLVFSVTSTNGEGLEAREVDELLFELRTASNMRVYLDQVVQASEHRTHRLLKAMKLSEDAIASGCYGVVWVSRGSVDLHATADANISISLPAIDLPQLLRAKMRQVEVPLDGLCFTRGSGDALKPALGGFCVAAASPHGQWLASVSMDEMAVVLG